MRPNRELSLAVRRALATGTITLWCLGAAAANAQQATTSQATPAQATTVNAATQASTAKKSTEKTATAQKRILLAQAMSVPAPASADNNAPVATLQTVVVTGTMIARPAAETAEAITILKADALKDQGITNV